MRRLFAALTMLLFAGCFAVAQQSPPADGVGLGNEHLSGNGSVSNVPSMSPDQNSVMSDSNGSTTGDKGIPAFAGSGGAETATEMNGQGTMGVSQSTAVTAARRAPYGIAASNQNRAVVVQNGNQANPTIGSGGQNAGAQQGQGGRKAPPQR
jgi:hypothetical protein